MKKFLKENYNLHRDPALLDQAKKQKKLNTSDPDSIIGNLMRKYELALSKNFDDEAKNRPLQVIKNYLYEQVLLKPEHIPESYREFLAKNARERGEGAHLENGKFPRSLRSAQAEVLINDQKETLNAWLDYLSRPDANYPIELKYRVIRSLITLQAFDKEKGKFPKRTKTTTANFPELNQEALAQVINAKDAEIRKQPLHNFGLSDDDFELFCQKKNFADRYALALTATLGDHSEGLANIRGERVKYPRGSAPDQLVASLEGQGTGRCTAGYSTAKAQLQGGDFYVYYSQEKGQNTKPRLAIRMEGSQIAEVRGIAANQNLDPYISPVLDKKLSKFGAEGERYQKRVADMQHLTAIGHKIDTHQQLSDQDVEFLYFNEKGISGFGYQQDSRIDEFQHDLSCINALLDYCSKYPKKRCNFNFRKISELPVGFVFPETMGDLNLGGLTSLPENIKFPETMRDLYLSGLTSLPENIKFPETMGDLNLGGLTSLPENIRFPETMRYFDLGGLTSLPENIRFPETMRYFDLGGLTSLPENIKFPETMRSLNLSHLTSLPENIRFPETMRYLNLGGLTSLPENIKFPETMGDLNLGGLTSFPENIKFPETMGDLYLWGLTSLPENIRFPETMRDLHLSRLRSLPENIKFPETMRDLYLSGLTSLPENIRFPETMRYFDLGGLTSLPENIKFPATMERLNLSGLTSLPENVENLKGIYRFLPGALQREYDEKRNKKHG